MTEVIGFKMQLLNLLGLPHCHCEAQDSSPAIRNGLRSLGRESMGLLHTFQVLAMTKTKCLINQSTIKIEGGIQQ